MLPTKAAPRGAKASAEARAMLPPVLTGMLADRSAAFGVLAEIEAPRLDRLEIRKCGRKTVRHAS
jgi:hypothetical protein